MSTAAPRADQMTLFLFLAPVGYQTGAWRDPASRAELLYGLELPASIARRAEAAKLHAVFLADFVFFGPTGKNPASAGGYEPLTTMAAIAAVTQKIGLVCTASTTFMEPYYLARYFSQLDWLSGGRAGWNIVTSRDGSQNFTKDLPDRDTRYEIAHEYMDVVSRIWNAWEPDAVICDRVQGIWADNAKIHPVDYKSDNFRVTEPLCHPRSPQGRPLFVQAGGSDAGRDFAAQWAEAIYAVQASMADAQSFYNDVKARGSRLGRDPETIRVLPGLMPIIGDTEADARRLYDELYDYMDIEVGLKQLSKALHDVDLSGLDPDQPIPLERLVDPDVAIAQDAASRYIGYYRLATEEKYTLRQMVRHTLQARGHGVVVGTAEQIADHMETWYLNHAGDGFALLPPTSSVGLDKIFDQLIPTLQDRGLFHKEYAHQLLRDNIGS